MKTFIGIDCGLKGAIVAIREHKIVDKTVMPIYNSTKSKNEYDLGEIVKFLRKFDDPFVTIEKLHAMPKLGSVQAFNLGRGFGIMLGIVSALGYSYQLVHSKTWQKKMFTDLSKKDTKQMSKIMAQRIFPNVDFKATPRCKNLHDGTTDAALICLYGVQSFTGWDLQKEKDIV